MFKSFPRQPFQAFPTNSFDGSDYLFSPLNLNPIRWFSPDHCTFDVGRVSQMDDLAQGKHATQGIDEAKPIYIPNAYNGAAMLEYNGTSQYFLTAPILPKVREVYFITNAQKLPTLFQDIFNTPISNASSNSYNTMVMFRQSDAIVFRSVLWRISDATQTSRDSTTALPSGFYITRMDCEDNSARTYINEVSQDGSNTNYTAALPTITYSTIGVRATGAGATAGTFLKGYLGDLIMFDYDLNNFQRSQMVDWFRRKYKIAI
jgi:hypothetical protein